ncbi:Uncharacterised protein [Klebsiella pneumoniae]|nr:hypothetical protein [Klebsiella pneumoniae]SAX62351.1 Uncharacterised protein [Klebsiella pneumoniae]SBF26642.1 Uncharacterised protein [Klebsiella pneumoniae]
MTKSTITRERLEWLSQISCRDDIEDIGGDEIRELASIALAAMDSEPVAEVVSIYGDPEAFGGREIRPLVGIQQMPYGTKLYRHAQPAPVVPEEATPDSIEILASARRRDHAVFQWDEDQRNAAADSWNAFRAAMLQELKKSAGTEAICRSDENVQVLHANPPVIPDGSASMLRRWLAFGRGMQNAGCQLPHNLIAESEAMLAAAPHDTPALNSVQSVVTVPDKWIPVSERMPENDVSVLTFDGMYKEFIMPCMVIGSAGSQRKSPTGCRCRQPLRR